MKTLLFIVSLCFIINCSSAQDLGNEISSYSIVAWDSLTGDLGIAVKSNIIGAGSILPFAKAGVGAIVTQCIPNPSLALLGLNFLEHGENAYQVGNELINSDTGKSYRQIALIDMKGNAFAYTGTSCKFYSGHILGNSYTIQGSMLNSAEVLKTIEQTFLQTTGDLSERLLRTMEAAAKLTNDNKSNQSAALLVVRDNGGFGGNGDRFVDIRVDDDSLPIVQLRRVYNLWQQKYLFDARLLSIDEMNKKKKFIAADTEKKRLADSFNTQLKQSPGDPKLLNKIAWILATKDIDKEQAIELAKRAVKLMPNEPNYLETLAECHFRLNHIDEAIAIETELASKDPANDLHWRQLQKFREAKALQGK